MFQEVRDREQHIFIDFQVIISQALKKKSLSFFTSGKAIAWICPTNF